MQLNGFHCTNVILVVLDEPLYRCLVDSRIVTKYGNGFFLTVVCLADTGPLRPRIAFGTSVRQLRHHFQLYHRLAAVANGSTDAVVTRIAAADDDDILILGTDIVTVRQVGVDQALCGGFQEIHRIVNAVCVPTVCIDVSRIRRTTRQNDCIILFQQLLRRNVLAHIYAGAELYALFLHHVHTPLYYSFFQLHVRDSVHQQTAYTVFPFEYCHMMSTLVQLQCCRQTGRTGTDHCHTLAGADFRRICLDVPAGKCLFDNGVFIFLDGDRIAVQTAGTCLFTQCRTNTGGEFRKTVGQQQPIRSFFPEAVVDHVVPLRTKVIQRAAGNHAKDRLACLTERDTAVHTAGTLFPAFFVGKRGMKFPIGLNSFQRFLSSIFDSLIFEKSS